MTAVVANRLGRVKTCNTVVENNRTLGELTSTLRVFSDEIKRHWPRVTGLEIFTNKSIIFPYGPPRFGEEQLGWLARCSYAR